MLPDLADRAGDRHGCSPAQGRGCEEITEGHQGYADQRGEHNEESEPVLRAPGRHLIKFAVTGADIDQRIILIDASRLGAGATRGTQGMQSHCLGGDVATALRAQLLAIETVLSHSAAPGGENNPCRGFVGRFVGGLVRGVLVGVRTQLAQPLGSGQCGFASLRPETAHMGDGSPVQQGRGGGEELPQRGVGSFTDHQGYQPQRSRQPEPHPEEWHCDRVGLRQPGTNLSTALRGRQPQCAAVTVHHLARGRSRPPDAGGGFKHGERTDLAGPGT